MDIGRSDCPCVETKCQQRTDQREYRQHQHSSVGQRLVGGVQERGDAKQETSWLGLPNKRE